MQFTASKRRTLSVFSLVMINVIAIDSLRNLPTNAANGLAIPCYYLLATLFFLLPCALITAELATHYPKTGGAYVWVSKAFGPYWGFVAIWLQWVYNLFWYPTILAFIAANIAYLFAPNLATQKTFMITMIITLFSLSTVVNLFGMRLSSVVSALSAIIGTIIPMVAIIILSLFWLAQGKPLALDISWHNWLPSLSHFNNVAFLVIVFFSLFGLEMSAVHAEEVKNPQRDYPRALVISSLIIVTTLILSSTAIAIVVPKSALNIVSGLDQAFHIFLNQLGLNWLFPLIVLCIILGSFGNMAAWVIGPTKGLVVAAETGHAPAILAKRNRHGVPVSILLLQLLVVIALCGFFIFMPTFNTSYWILSDLTAQLALLFYVLLFAAAIRLRYKTASNPQAFRIGRSPLGIWIVGLLGIMACSGAMIVGFIPPQDIQLHSIWQYELILIVGVVLFATAPALLYQSNKKDR